MKKKQLCGKLNCLQVGLRTIYRLKQSEESLRKGEKIDLNGVHNLFFLKKKKTLVIIGHLGSLGGRFYRRTQKRSL